LVFVFTYPFLLISVFKFLTIYLLRKYRTVLRGNIRRVIVIGSNDKTRQLIKTFNTRLDFGYKFEGEFSLKDEHVSLDNCFDLCFLSNHETVLITKNLIVINLDQ